jgi:hypothetical protein
VSVGCFVDRTALD